MKVFFVSVFSFVRFGGIMLLLLVRVGHMSIPPRRVYRHVTAILFGLRVSCSLLYVISHISSWKWFSFLNDIMYCSIVVMSGLFCVSRCMNMLPQSGCLVILQLLRSRFDDIFSLVVWLFGLGSIFIMLGFSLYVSSCMVCVLCVFSIVV